MVQLKTVKDFEKVAKALQDFNTKPHQYQVKSFGYCTECRKVVEYKVDVGLGNLRYKECLNCNTKDYNTYSDSRILTGKNVPVSAREEVDKFHSRKQQKKYFAEMVKQRFSEIKSEILKKQQEIEALNEDSKRLTKLISS